MQEDIKIFKVSMKGMEVETSIPYDCGIWTCLDICKKMLYAVGLKRDDIENALTEFPKDPQMSKVINGQIEFRVKGDEYDTMIKIEGFNSMKKFIWVIQNLLVASGFTAVMVYEAFEEYDSVDGDYEEAHIYE